MIQMRFVMLFPDFLTLAIKSLNPGQEISEFKTIYWAIRSNEYLKYIAMSLEEMKELARRKYEDYKQSDIDKSLAIFPAFTDFKVTVESQAIEGKLVTSHWRMHGFHTGEFLGIPPTGKEVTLCGTTIDLVNNGKVVEYSTTMDFEGFLKQMKMIL